MNLWTGASLLALAKSIYYVWTEEKHLQTSLDWFGENVTVREYWHAEQNKF